MTSGAPCDAEGTFCWKVLPLTDVWGEILQNSVQTKTLEVQP